MVARILLAAASSYTIALTVLSLVSLGKISIGSFNPTDKMMHSGAYFLLVVIWMLYIVFRESNFSRYRANLLKVSGMAVLFGMLIEVLQGSFTSYRQPDWYDILANTTGVLFAAVSLLIFKNLLKRLKSKINLVF
ncbi:VanZ family protein [Salegentibacter chungangensis]|uniref:VanZ family protein n=1 Tax=Salegentibacter chungangensis TaxID=1335724 RepID=A0ABW3NN51_9FLAO